MKKGKKAADGSGSIRQRPDGRWEGRYTYTDPRTGKTCRSSIYGKTKKEVAEKLRARTAEVDKGNYIPDSSMTLEQWSEIYIRDYLIPQSANGDKSNGTEKSYRSILNNHILPVLGQKRLKDIKSLDIQRLLNNLENKANPETPLSAKTILNIHGVIHAVLEQAVNIPDFPILQKNPADKKYLKLPKYVKKEPRSITEEELPPLLEAIQGHPYELLYCFDLMSGLRQGEALGLSWDCIDWKKSTVLVKSQVNYGGSGKGYNFVSTKSHNTRRVIVSNEALELLRKQKARQEEAENLAGCAWDNSHNLVFTNELGGHLKHYQVYRPLKRILRKLGMDDATFHSLRHSYATFAIQAKNSIKTVQANMGHYSAAFTMDTYVSDLDHGKRTDAENFSNYLQNVISGSKGSDEGSSVDG